MNLGIKRPRPAMVIAVIALIVALSGTALAALGKNTIGSRQLKSKSVKTAKFADESVTAAKVPKETLTGQNIDVNQLGTVPKAVNAKQANDADAVNGHPATCPGGTILIRGLCFDSVSNPPILGVKAAADACASRGGRLPTPSELYSVRSVIDLGTGAKIYKEPTPPKTEEQYLPGTGTDAQFTDSYFYDYFRPLTTVVYSTDSKSVQNEEGEEVLAKFEYICAYQLIR
jgi:hypothetical protein